MEQNCKTCECLLTPEIKRGNFCKPCYGKRRLELKSQRTDTGYVDKSIVRLCIECEKPRDDAKHGRYCISCFDKRRAEKKRGTKPGTIPMQVVDGMKTCSKCNVSKNVDNFRLTRNTCQECEQEQGREFQRQARLTRGDQIRQAKREYERKRRQTDLSYKLIASYRTRIWQVVKKRKTWRSGCLLDCDQNTFIAWIMFNFKDGMTLENYGTYWHLDHVIPCASFDFMDDAQVSKCFHWSNLVPLEGYINVSKRAKIEIPTITYYREKAKAFLELPENKDKGLKLLELTVPKTSGNT